MCAVYGTDYQGNVCGGKYSTESANKYTAYPRTNEDFVLNVGKTNPLDYKFYGVCADCERERSSVLRHRE